MTRVIIDIPVEDPVKIYCASVDTGPILNLKWDQVIDRIEVVKEKEPAICRTPNSPFYGVPVGVHYQMVEGDMVSTLHKMPITEFWATTNPEKITCGLCKQLFAERFSKPPESTEKGS